MPHEIAHGPQANILYMRIWGELLHEDMLCDDELGLNDSQKFIFLDVSEMENGLPTDFLDGARNSFFINPNMMHLAIYTDSAMLDIIAKMVSKVTRRQDKMSLHKSPQAARDYIWDMAQQ